MAESPFSFEACDALLASLEPGTHQNPPSRNSEESSIENFETLFAPVSPFSFPEEEFYLSNTRNGRNTGFDASLFPTISAADSSSSVSSMSFAPPASCTSSATSVGSEELNIKTNNGTPNDATIKQAVPSFPDPFDFPGSSTSQGNSAHQTHPTTNSTYRSLSEPHIKPNSKPRSPVPSRTRSIPAVLSPSPGFTFHASIDRTTGKITKPYRKEKSAHNMVEKRYRTNINDKITALRDSVPALKVLVDDSTDAADLEGLAPAKKLNKATVLTKATEYIQHLERKNRKLQAENAEFRAKIKALAVPNSSTDGETRQNPRELKTTKESQQPMNSSTDTSRPRGSTSSLSPFSDSESPESTSASSVSSPRSRSGSEKLLVGTMAGVLATGLFEEISQDTRGLWAVPFGPLGAVRAHGIPSGFSAAFLAIKCVLLVATVAFLLSELFIYLGGSSRSGKQTNMGNGFQSRQQLWRHYTREQSMPSAGPLARLTGVVLIAKAGVSVVARHVLPVRWRPELSTEQCTAWERAIEAQLSGGDPQVSTTRLVYTFLRGLLLPVTVERCLIRAVHAKVIASAELPRPLSAVASIIGDKVAQYNWRKARHVYLTSFQEKCDNYVALPASHVRILALSPEVARSQPLAARMANIAWRRPAELGCASRANTAVYHSILTDPAVASPLDILAAFYANDLLDKLLVAKIEHGSVPGLEAGMKKCVDIAPEHSIVHRRATVAQAVLAPPRRDKFTALGRAVRAVRAVQAVKKDDSYPESHDTQAAITCAFITAFTSRGDVANALRFLFKIHLSAPEDFGVLGFNALLETLTGIAEITKCDSSLLTQRDLKMLEKLAGLARIWIGGLLGENAGVSVERRSDLAELLIGYGKQFSGC